MQLLHAIARTRASFDDPNLVAHAGLVPLAALAERAGLHELAVPARPAGDAGANAALKTACLAIGMAAGADSIDDMGLLRHGAMEVLFGGVRAPPRPGRSCGPSPGETSVDDVLARSQQRDLSWAPVVAATTAADLRLRCRPAGLGEHEAHVGRTVQAPVLHGRGKNGPLHEQGPST